MKVPVKYYHEEDVLAVDGWYKLHVRSLVNT